MGKRGRGGGGCGMQTGCQLIVKNYRLRLKKSFAIELEIFLPLMGDRNLRHSLS